MSRLAVAVVVTASIAVGVVFGLRTQSGEPDPRRADPRAIDSGPADAVPPDAGVAPAHPHFDALGGTPARSTEPPPRELVAASPGEHTAQRSMLPSQSVLCVTARTPLGAPLTAYALRVKSLVEGAEVLGTEVRAADGVAQITAVPPGRARVEVLPVDSRWGPEWRIVEVDADGSGAVEVVVGPGFVVRGRVLDEQAQPIANAIVVLEAAKPRRSRAPKFRATAPGADAAIEVRRRTAADGTFEFGCRADELYAVMAQAIGYVGGGTGFRLPREMDLPVVITLTRAGSLSGSFAPTEAWGWLQRYTAQGIPGRQGTVPLAIWAYPHGAGLAIRRAEFVEPGAGGRFRLHSLPLGGWEVSVVSPAGSHVAGVWELHRGRYDAELTLDLADLEPGLLTGCATTHDPAATVTAIRLRSKEGAMEVPVGPDGRYEIAAPTGEWALRVLVERGGRLVTVAAARPVTMRRGQTVTRDLAVGLQSLDVGLASATSNQPLVGAVFSIDEERAVGVHRIYTTDHRGVGSVDPAPIGEFGVSVRQPDASWRHVGRVDAQRSGGAVTLFVVE